MTAPQHQDHWSTSRDGRGLEPDAARKQRLRLIVISVVAACGVLTLVGGVMSLVH